MIKKYHRAEQRTLLGNKQNSLSFASHICNYTHPHFGFSAFFKNKNKKIFYHSVLSILYSTFRGERVMTALSEGTPQPQQLGHCRIWICEPWLNTESGKRAWHQKQLTKRRRYPEREKQLATVTCMCILKDVWWRSGLTLIKGPQIQNPMYCKGHSFVGSDFKRMWKVDSRRERRHKTTE